MVENTPAERCEHFEVSIIAEDVRKTKNPEISLTFSSAQKCTIAVSKVGRLLLQGRNALLHLLECGFHATERGLLDALEAVELQHVVVEAHNGGHLGRCTIQY